MTGVPHGRLGENPGHGGEIGAADRGHQRQRIVDEVATAPHTVADGGGLADPPASSIPVRPTTTTGSSWASSPTRIAAGVVFLMPMSPAISRSTPESTSSSVMARPAATACRASASVIASVTRRSLLPRQTFVPRHRRRGVGDDGDVLDAHRGARASGQDIDRGPAGDEVGHHLLGDHLREG